jgi:hypothetical protein
MYILLKTEIKILVIISQVFDSIEFFVFLFQNNFVLSYHIKYNVLEYNK